MNAFDRPLAALLAALLALPPGYAWADEPPKPPRDLYAESDALVAEIPAERYDVAARAAALGEGVDAAFAFVRDRIGYEAYPGVLRGARVTLATEAGNSFDRALLLAELLRVRGVTTRFALGRLSTADAQRLLDRVFDPPSRPAGVAPPGDGGALPGQPELVGLVRARAARDYAGIRAAMGDAFPRGGSTRDDALKDVAAHAWVQAKVGDAWVDLDPSFRDAVPGKTLATAQSTVDEFPAEVEQSVTLRVVTETLSGGNLASETNLQLTAPAAQLVDTLVLLGHAPLTGGLVEGVGSGIVGAAESWQPFVWVDGASRAGTAIAYHESTGKTARGGPPSGGLGGAFGPGGALGSRRDLVAEWLEVEVSAPGRPPEVSRRALLDRAGPAWRAKETKDASALRPMPRTGKSVTTPRELHVLWFTAGRHDLAALAGAYRSLLEPRTGKTPEEKLVDGVWPLAVQSAAIAVVSDHLLLPSLEDRPTSRFYADSPRLLLFSAGPEAGPEGGSRFVVDLPRDSIRGVAQAPGDEAEVAARKVWFGCLQGALEHEFCSIYAKDPEGTPVEVVSTCSLHGPDGLVAVRAGSATPAEIADPERAARVAAALSRGRSVVAPKAVLRGGTLGWWEVAADGTTRTVLEDDLKSARGSGRIPGVVPGNPSGDTTLPSDWMDRARGRGQPGGNFPGANEPTAPGGPANPSGAPRPTPPRPTGGPGGAPRPTPPRPPSGPMRPPSGGGGGGGGGGRSSRSRMSGTELLLIVALVTILVIAALQFFIPQFFAGGTQYVANQIKDIFKGSFIAGRNRRP